MTIGVGRVGLIVLVTALVFLAGEAVMLPNVMQPLFKSILGDQILDGLRLGPAAIFYIIHICGLTWFASLPALRAGRAIAALRDGALLGLVAYGCYELTSWTIMVTWSPVLVVADMAWGATISGLSAWAAVLAARALWPPAA